MGYASLPADQPGLRRGNLALLLRALREHGSLSRAQLAVLSGLSKAAVSSLIAELTERRLVRDAGLALGGGGRPGQLVELDPEHVFGIGLDVHADQVGAMVTDLSGATVARFRVPGDVTELKMVGALDALAAVATRALAVVRERGGWASAITVSVPGLVDTASGCVQIAPRLRWRSVSVADELAARTGLDLALFAVDNDANLAATAEFEAVADTDLIFLIGDFGIGAGVITGGRLVRGALGYAGEVGHMSMDPLGPNCSCGRRGCWETQVGLGALLHLCAAPDDPVRDPALDLAERVSLLRARAVGGDRRTLDALHQVGIALGLGVSIMVNLFNPAVVVLGGYFAALPEWLVAPIRAEVMPRVLAEGAGRARVITSSHGFDAAVTGAALTSLRRVFDDPTVVSAPQPESTVDESMEVSS